MTTLLKAIGISKRFGGLTAVEKAGLDVNAGEVVGVVGGNGAGKSTLANMISGVYPPDEGEIDWNGKRVRFSGPQDARRLGIETVYQDLALAENLDVGANIFLGRELECSRLGGFVRTLDRSRMRLEAVRVLGRLDVPLPAPTERVRDLSADQRQAVALARALYGQAKLVILDEPASALNGSEKFKALAWGADAARPGRGGDHYQPRRRGCVRGRGPGGS